MRRQMSVLLRGITLVTLSCLIAACAGGVAITKADKAKIGAVAIDTNVALPEEPYIQGGNARIAFLLMGGAGVATESMSASKAFKVYMGKNQVDLAKIVATSFEENIKMDNVLKIRDDGTHRLRLKVNTFGYGESRFLGLVTPKVYRKPLMNITATLVDADNKVLWEKTAFLTPQSDKTTEYTFEDLAGKPEKTIESLTEIARLLAAEIMEDFLNN